MHAITLHSAGAGTGKTYKICEEIADRVAAGLDPRRILAATFTRAAAAELKSRVQGHLLRKGLVQKAEELELAAMGTVHSVGHQLVSRFAFRLGLSPDLEILTEDSQETWLKDMLTGLDPAPLERFLELCRRFELDKGIIFKLITAKRQNDIPDKEFRRQILDSAHRLCEVLGTGKGGKGGLADAVKDAQDRAKAALHALKLLPDHEKEPAYATLSRLVRYGADNWRQLSNLGKLKSEDDKAHACLNPVRDFAERLLRHPGLGADIAAFAEALAEQALALEAHYRRYKIERGLLDYTDLEELFYKLITNPALREELAEEIHLVVIDEFQDTNPIQLAIFMALSSLSKESIWVGDHKQSIYGFNGTDPELMHAVWELPHVKQGTLKANRRSGKGLVDFFNEVFTPVFGAKSKLEHVHKAESAAIERWLLEAKNYGEEAQALANAIQQLLGKGVRKSEVAVLVRTNEYAEALGEQLQELAIPVALTLSGLLSTRECAALVAALRVVADRQDSLACATLLQLLDGGPDAWLEHRLEALHKTEKAPPFAGHPVIDALAGLDHRSLSPSAALTAAMDVLGLGARLGHWSEPARRNTHLDSLLALARTYEEEAAKEGRAVTLTGFITYLEELEGEGNDKRTPPNGLDAVNIRTYHKAKGLEWPVVVLAQLDKTYDGDPCAPWVDGGNPKHAKPLDGRAVHYWPCPLGEYPSKAFNSIIQRTDEYRDLCRKEQEESIRILYVGFTRARDRLVLATRVKETKKDGEKHAHSWLDSLPSFAKVAGATKPGSHKLHNIDTTLVVSRHPSENPHEPPPPAAHVWLEEPKPSKKDFTPRLRNPSQEPPVKAALKAEHLPGPQPNFGRISTEHFDLLGDAVHAYLGALPSLADAPEKTKLACAKKALESFGMEGTISPEPLVEAGERFRAWVEKTYPGARWHTEVPVTAPSQDGRQWHGIIDLLLEIPDGRLAIVDHKSAPIGEKVWSTKAQEFSGQIMGYAEALKACGLKEVGCWIHFPLGGGLVKAG